MVNVAALREAKVFILQEWRRIVRDAEELHETDNDGSKEYARRVQKTAQEMLVLEVQNKVSADLSKGDIQYAVDLFNTLCITSYDKFHVIKSNLSILETLRGLRDSTFDGVESNR